MNKRRQFLFAAFALALLAGGAQAQNKTVAIGYQAPLSGENAQYGVQFRNSAALAVDQFNKSGKLPGRERSGLSGLDGYVSHAPHGGWRGVR